jgi:hypothetical protein
MCVCSGCSMVRCIVWALECSRGVRGCCRMSSVWVFAGNGSLECWGSTVQCTFNVSAGGPMIRARARLPESVDKYVDVSNLNEAGFVAARRHNTDTSHFPTKTLIRVAAKGRSHPHTSFCSTSLTYLHIGLRAACSNFPACGEGLLGLLLLRWNKQVLLGLLTTFG